MPSLEEEGKGKEGAGIEPDLIEIAKCLVENLKARWTETNPGVEEILDRVGRWADPDLRIHMLGWIATRNDDRIKKEAVEMVGSMEEVVYTNTITKLGESIMTDVMEICTILTTKRTRHHER